MELSGASRLARDGARWIMQGLAHSEEAKQSLNAAKALQEGAIFPELILVGLTQGDNLVVLEGHIRLTAYLLWSDHLPPEVPAIVGYSKALPSWAFY